VRVNRVDPPGALRRLRRRKLELVTMALEGRREAHLVDPPACGIPRAGVGAASGADEVPDRGRMMAGNYQRLDGGPKRLEEALPEREHGRTIPRRRRAGRRRAVKSPPRCWRA
jgi:hypothetical protein